MKQQAWIEYTAYDGSSFRISTRVHESGGVYTFPDYPPPPLQQSLVLECSFSQVVEEK